MAFLDKFDKKLAMLGQGAIQKTKEVTDTAKLSSAIKGLEFQKKDAFAELGQIYYENYKQYGGNPDENSFSIISGIEEIEQQIAQYKEEMRKIKGVIYCPNCNAQIPANSLFCNVCGAKMEAQPNPVQEAVSGIAQNEDAVPYAQQTAEKRCSQCNAVIEPDQMFCVNCGKKVENESGYSQETEAEVVCQETAEEIPAGNICPECGKEIGEGQRFCTSCGTKIY